MPVNILSMVCNHCKNVLEETYTEILKPFESLLNITGLLVSGT